MSKSTPAHLGGHANTTHLDSGALEWFRDEHDCRSMIDLGCGPGGQVALARDLGYRAIGIDGDPACNPDILHDFSTGRLTLHEPADLLWCVEFLEHLDARYLPNLSDVIRSARFIVITHALPDSPGHHHVNCRSPDYWSGFFAANGYWSNPVLTKQLKYKSTMAREFIAKTGAVFVPFS